MDSAVLEEVLKEISQQQKEILEASGKEHEATQQMFIKLEAFEKKLEILKGPAASNTLTLITSVKKCFEEIKALFEAHPKTVVHQRSFQLFFNKSEEYYKLIFGSIFKGLVILVIGIYALVIINRYIREREYLHYKQAWQYLYNTQNEDGKQFLEKIMRANGQENTSTVTKMNTDNIEGSPKNGKTQVK